MKTILCGAVMAIGAAGMAVCDGCAGKTGWMGIDLTLVLALSFGVGLRIGMWRPAHS